MNNFIKETLNEFADFLLEKDSNSSLYIPKYRDNGIRYSEQELRQFFIEKIIKNGKWKYSVETPTKEKYIFKKVDVPVINQNGKSARFDLTVYENDKSVCHIEFKQGQSEKKQIQKDLLKLAHEENDSKKENYFILYEKCGSKQDSNMNQRTYDALKDKVTEAFKDIEKGNVPVKVFILVVSDTDKKIEEMSL